MQKSDIAHILRDIVGSLSLRKKPVFTPPSEYPAPKADDRYPGPQPLKNAGTRLTLESRVPAIS